ncbi:hypothetical protein Franean1_2939 [Parafrankia sp. EAN1pec]|uniref:hypothetical protein n=1 Tax=Parafrankia sp. (strain EAN1pec) TaxID=298653 RepID=UPI0000540D10|nr:hypothetical protein Franean1_2939 [Frankia sp. EAN1pec]
MEIIRPVDLQAPHAAYLTFYIVFVLSALATTALIAQRAVKLRSLLPLAALAGGAAIGIVMPPILNVLTLVWFPSNIPGTAVTAFGMRDPVFDAIGYALFIGFGGWVFCEQLTAGRGRRALVETFLVWGVSDLIIELPFLHWGMYTYYGSQPLTVMGFPLHWVLMNGLVPVISGYTMYLVTAHWPAGKAGAPWRVLVCPALAAGVLFIPVAPVATALNAQISDWVRVAAALVSMVMSLAILRWIARNLPGPVGPTVLGTAEVVGNHRPSSASLASARPRDPVS